MPHWTCAPATPSTVSSSTGACSGSGRKRASCRSCRSSTPSATAVAARAPAAYLTQVAATNGQNTAAGTPYEQAHPALLAWTQSSAADRGTDELTLHDLKRMQQG